MQDLYVIKIGGNIIDDDEKLSAFLQQFAALSGNKVLVHGGGKLATKMAGQLGIEQQMVDGRRITDAETLKIVTMVYAGYINKNIVAQLQSKGCNAIGLTGADANLIPAKKRTHASIDFGFVGDVESLQPAVEHWKLLLQNGLVPVVAPITHNGEGQLLNTNADTIAQEIAKALGKLYKVRLVYSFEKPGVLLDVQDEASVIGRLNPSYYSELKQKGLIFAGMIPKLDNAFAALDNGVQTVIIGRAEELPGLIAGNAGTTITHD
ncbi:MAG TPA: acetylglutamate kinase [Chitinophagaceae bacterium]|nr:acetylglutamate kinase [Chitinophagaceae bacterium]